MLLALIWWTVLLSRYNQTIYETRVNLFALEEKESHAASPNSDVLKNMQKQYIRSKYMIIGEGIVFGLSMIIGMWFIQKAHLKEIENTRKQKNFLLSVTHELKSPVASIRLIAETIMQRSLPHDKIVSLNEGIMKESVRLENLINNLLLASRINNAYQYNFEWCNLPELIEEVKSHIQRSHPDTGLRIHGRQKDFFILADREAMISVINNLIENAVKYSPHPAQVDISYDMKKNQCILEIADQGSGITDQEKSKIFQQFYRVGNEETRQTKGTGLGLYITEKIILAHKGKITVSDNHPKGTIFTVTLPKVKENENFTG
jgi:signal transduction histidine kinase